MLSTATWINPNGGDWSDKSNWSAEQLPGTYDDVVINVLNPGSVVTCPPGYFSAIHSLTAAAPIMIGGGLDLSGGTYSEGTFTAGAVTSSSAIARTRIRAVRAAP
jgi:hypothetical protein